MLADRGAQEKRGARYRPPPTSASHRKAPPLGRASSKPKERPFDSGALPYRPAPKGQPAGSGGAVLSLPGALPLPSIINLLQSHQIVSHETQ